MPVPSAPPQIQLPFAKSHAFIIGINDYEHISSLSTAVNDAQGIAKRLEEQHGYLVHEPLLNAKKADILKWLQEEIPQSVGQDDRIVFYFAGHGIALDSEEGPNGFLVPADARAGDIDSLIPMDGFHKMLNELPCKHGLLILDCCFAGAFKWSSGFRDFVFDLPGILYEERFWRYVKDPAWQVITSSAYDQKAVDVLSNRSLGLREKGTSERHSPFAQALFEALEGGGDIIPKGKGNGVITATELYIYLRDKVEDDTTAESIRQTPSLFMLSKHDKGEFIFLHPRHRLNLPPAPDRNPFKGLSSYDERDASLFFGRDRVVEALAEMIPKNPLMVVGGASGTGKSSVIKAGLLPRLRREGWQVLPIIRPGKTPKTNLDNTLPNAEKQFQENPKTVLVIDQYEELITQTLTPREKNAFELQLATWLKAFPDLRIILSIRSDFEPQFEKSALKPWWHSGRYIVPAFSLDEIREIIVKPANQEVLFYEPDELIDKLVEEVSQAPGALPLLSFTLSELYEAYLKSGRSDRALIEADYKELGGVVGALRTRADATYDGLDSAHQDSMRKLMLRMASLEGGELAGNRVYANELEFADQAETQRLQQVAKKLVEARLILTGKDGQGAVYTEPAHDALIRAWARLWEWIKATGEENLSLHNKLGLAVNDYQDLIETQPQKAKNLLWNNDPRLNILQAELKSKSHNLNAREAAFVQSSVKRRSARKRNTWLITIAVMIGLAGLAIFAFIQQGNAVEQSKEAEKQGKEAIKQRDIAKTEALNATLRTYLSESRRNETLNPLLAFRYAEAGYDSTKMYGLDTKEFRNQLIKIAYSGLPIELGNERKYTVDTTVKQGTAVDHELTIGWRGSVKEKDKNGDILHEYGVNAMDAFFSDNGKYLVLVELVNYGKNYTLFSHKREELASAFGFGIATGAEWGEEAEDPFLFDQNGKVTVVFDGSVARLYDENFGERSKLDNYGGNTSAMALSPSGKYFAAASQYGKVSLSIIDWGNPYGRYEITNSEFTPHPNKQVTELAFCNKETVLKTVAGEEVKYWLLTNALQSFQWKSTFELRYGIPNEEGFDGSSLAALNKHTFKDPVTGEKFTLSSSFYEGGSNSLSIDMKGLSSDKGEVLILFNSSGLDYLGLFSKDSRYVFSTVDEALFIYPIDPQLILDRINVHKIWGELPDVSIKEIETSTETQ